MTRPSPEPPRLPLFRQEVRVDQPASLDALLARLHVRIPGTQTAERAIVINIGECGAERLVLFCAANASPTLLAAETVLVDVAADSVYRPFVRSIIAGAAGAALAIRDALRSAPVSSLAHVFAQLCQQLDVVALMAEGYALQRRDAELLAQAGAVSAASRALRESAAMHDDNVRCMDDLHYEVTPALQRLDQRFI